MNPPIKVLFASGSAELIPTAIEEMQKLLPELPLVVVSEFPLAGVDWIRYPIARGLRENLSLFRWHFRGQRVHLSAVILQPRVPYRQMRLIAFLLAPLKFLAFNENFGHFMLRPQSLATIVGHLVWRARNYLVWQFSPGGAWYTFLRGLAHPSALRQPMSALSAKLACVVLTVLKAVLPAKRRASPSTQPRPRGISVVIPSRHGKDLLAALLPETVHQIASIGGEVIVVDNGSGDGSADFLTQTYPEIRFHCDAQPLSFAVAANAGVRMASY